MRPHKKIFILSYDQQNRVYVRERNLRAYLMNRYRDLGSNMKKFTIYTYTFDKEIKAHEITPHGFEE